MKRWAILCAAAFAIGCGDDPSDPDPQPEPDPKLTGEWELVGDPGFDFDLDLRETASGTEEAGTMHGTALIQNDSISAVFTVSGFHDYPDVSLTFTATGWQPFTMSGELTAADRIAGELNGSGFQDFGVVWERVGD